MLNKYKLNYDDFLIQEKEEILYENIKNWVQKDSSEYIIEKFRYLFIKGNGCQCFESRDALETIINLKIKPQEFNFIFNRCCHIIIDEWQTNHQLRLKIPLLINQIALALPPNSTQSRTTRRLRQLILSFQESDQYLKLKRFSNLINQDRDRALVAKQQTIGNLIQRYPYLYQQCLTGEDSTRKYHNTVEKLQKSTQHRYELDLSRYITYRVRLVEIVRKYKANNQTKIPKKIIQPVKNPTLLNDRQLDRGLREYIGVVEANNHTYHSLAANFRDKLPNFSSHKELKQNFCTYLLTGMKNEYTKKTLEPKLVKHLNSILPDSHANQVDEFTLLRTCSLLLKFLVVDNLHNVNHYLFVDITANLGVTKVIGLLLKIVLVCDKALPYLEQRFAILFSHYENLNIDGVVWFVKALEYFQLALSIHFGKIDTSILKIV